MIVFCNANGTVTSVLPSPVYQGSALSGGLYFMAPFPKTNSVTVAFELPDGTVTGSYPLTPDGTVTDAYSLTPVIEGLENVVDKFGEKYSVWEWQTSNKEITAQAGTVTAQFYVGYSTGKEGDSEFQVQASAKVSFTVQKGVIPLPTETPSANQWDTLIALYSEVKASFDKVENIDINASKAAAAAISAESYANLAHSEADRAGTSAENAATSETNAATSESNALLYKNAAETAANNAATSETNAAQSETNAATYAERAEEASTIYDEDNNKKYTYQVKIKNGYPVLEMTEITA